MDAEVIAQKSIVELMAVVMNSMQEDYVKNTMNIEEYINFRGSRKNTTRPGSSPGVATSSLQMKYLFSRSWAVCEDSPVFLETN